jgi:hypothetical protein
VIANVGVANVLFECQFAWWFPGIAGIQIGVVWNYSATSIFLGARDERGMHFSYHACVEAFAQAILSNNEKYITMQGL